MTAHDFWEVEHVYEDYQTCVESFATEALAEAYKAGIEELTGSQFKIYHRSGEPINTLDGVFHLLDEKAEEHDVEDENEIAAAKKKATRSYEESLKNA